MPDSLFGSSEAGKRGGIARAKKLTSEQKSAQARAAAERRWEKEGKLKNKVLRATHGDATRPLRIGELEIPCYVLEGGMRVLSGRGTQAALNLGQGHGALLANFLGGKNLKPFINNELAMALKNPVRFVRPGRGGKLAVAYEATILADICDAVLEARKRTKLTAREKMVALQCEILTRAFAKVGIIALVDEATGYQRDRDRDDLAKILKAFVAKELQKWISTFPLEFYELICEVRGEPLSRAYKRPAYFGKITNNLIYERLAPGVLDDLRQKNPVIDNGKRRHKHFQYLTSDFGHPKLKEHLAGVVSVLRVAKLQSIGWEPFLRLVNKTHPKHPKMPLFDK